MKKLMIATCAIAFAAVSQAASINWGAAVCDGSAGNEAPVGTYAYLLYCGTTAPAAATTAITIAGVGEDAIGGKDNNDYAIVAFHEITSSDSLNAKFSDLYANADEDGGVNGYYRIILANESGDSFAIKDAEKAVTGISDTTSAGEALYNYSWKDYEHWLGDDDYAGSITVAPEPTSGLLLLLGVAGLALRRRRA